MKIKKLILSALFAALIFVATYIHIPTPSGYIHPADGVLIICSFVLGPLYGAASAALGSTLTDLFAGYAFYAPATFVIKGLMAVVSALILTKSNSRFRIFTASIVAEAIMVLGYFCFELIFYNEFAFIDILSNLVQAIAGIIISMLLCTLISKNKNIQYFIHSINS